MSVISADKHSCPPVTYSELVELAVKHKAFCRYCTANCGIVVETIGERVVSVRGRR